MRLVICLTLAGDKDAKPFVLFVAADKDMGGKVSRKEFEAACEKLEIDEIVGKSKFKEVVKSVKEDLTVEEYMEKMEEFRLMP